MLILFLKGKCISLEMPWETKQFFCRKKWFKIYFLLKKFGIICSRTLTVIISAKRLTKSQHSDSKAVLPLATSLLETIGYALAQVLSYFYLITLHTTLYLVDGLCWFDWIMRLIKVIVLSEQLWQHLYDEDVSQLLSKELLWMWTDAANKKLNSSWFQFNLRADPNLLNGELSCFSCVVLYSALIFFSIVLIFFFQLIISTVDTSMETAEVNKYTSEFLMWCIIHVVYSAQSCKSNCWYNCFPVERKRMWVALGKGLFLGTYFMCGRIGICSAKRW